MNESSTLVVCHKGSIVPLLRGRQGDGLEGSLSTSVAEIMRCYWGQRMWNWVGKEEGVPANPPGIAVSGVLSNFSCQC